MVHGVHLKVNDGQHITIKRNVSDPHPGRDDLPSGRVESRALRELLRTSC